MIPVAGLIGGALAGGAGAGGALGAVAGAGAFEAALSTAASAFGIGGGNQLEQKMVEGAVGVMGGMMMRLAGEALAAGMEDEGA